MPYHPIQSTQCIYDANVLIEYVNWQGQKWYSQNAKTTSTQQVPIYQDVRSGKNSSPSEVIRVYGIGAYEFTKVKKFVGYEFKQVEKLKWFRDRRGTLRSRTVTYTKRVPSFITVTRSKFIKPALDAPKSSEFYLKPNALFYGRVTNVIEPMANTVFKIEQGVQPLEKSIYRFDLNGPGVYRSPVGNMSLFYGFSEVGQVQESYWGKADLRERALRQLYSKVASDIPDYMTAAAESKELFRTLQTIVKESITLVKKIKRLDYQYFTGKLKAAPENLSAIWLTWVYGVSPVIGDIVDTIDVVKRSDRCWRAFSTHVKDTVRDDHDTTDVYFIGKRNIKIDATERYGIYLDGKLSVDRVWNSQVKWLSAAGTAYELVPFSFMLDWIVNISEYLKSAQILHGQSFFAWYTSLQEAEDIQTGRYGPNPEYPRMTMLSGEMSQYTKRILVSRNPVGNYLPDMPDIKVKKPAMDVLSLDRAINALAILVASTGGLKRPPGMQ
jgi:hypothetical protein